MKRNEGVSLIVLVITIIVILILAGTVILNLSNNNPVNAANEAKFKSNVKTYDTELSIILTDKYLKNNLFNPNNFNAGIWDGTGNVLGTIKEYITSITKDDAKKFEIQASKLVYTGTNALEMQWASEAGLSSGIIVFDGSVYNEEAEFYQYCLKALEYKTDSGNDIDIDGYFGNQSKSVLNKFLLAEGFSNFTYEARNKLVELAESKPYPAYNTGFITSQNNLNHLSFVYCKLSNIDNKSDPFYSINVLKNLPYIVTAEPSELSYSSKMVTEAIKSNTKLFGYVNLGPNNPTDAKASWIMSDLNEVKSQIDNIANAKWYGVFIDQFGYDWNETRARQNEIVDYAHSKGLSVMANGWFVDDIFASIVNDSNPTGTPTHLGANDWYLIESFFTDGTSYRADSSYIDKYIKAMQYHQSTGIKITTLSYKVSAKSWLESSEDIRISYILAECLNYNGWWFGKSDTSDNLTYGHDPSIDLGTFTQYLTYVSGTKYIAKTTKYTIEYYADSTPTINLLPNP